MGFEVSFKAFNLAPLNSEEKNPSSSASGETIITNDVGGIDLNPEMLDLNTQSHNIDFNVPVNLQELENMPINGLTPVIINIAPIMNINMLFGAEEDEGGLKSVQGKAGKSERDFTPLENEVL